MISELKNISERLSSNELKSSFAKFYYKEKKGNINVFKDDEGNSFEQLVYRYLSSLSALLHNYQNLDFYNSDNFEYIKENFLDDFRTENEKIELGYFSLIEEIIADVIELRFIFSMIESIGRIILAPGYFISVYFILNFEQRGLKVLSFMKKETILVLLSNITKFRNGLEGILDRREVIKRGGELSEESNEDEDDEELQEEDFCLDNSNEEKSEEVKPIKKKLKKSGGILKKNQKKKILLKKSEENIFEEEDDEVNDVKEEFDFDERGKYFRISQAKRKRFIVFSVVPIIFYFLFLGYSSYNFEIDIINNSAIFLQQIRFLTSAPKNIDYCMNFLIHDLTNPENKFTEKGNFVHERIFENNFFS